MCCYRAVRCPSWPRPGITICVQERGSTKPDGALPELRAQLRSRNRCSVGKDEIVVFCKRMPSRNIQVALTLTQKGQKSGSRTTPGNVKPNRQHQRDTLPLSILPNGIGPVQLSEVCSVSSLDAVRTGRRFERNRRLPLGKEPFLIVKVASEGPLVFPPNVLHG